MAVNLIQRKYREFSRLRDHKNFRRCLLENTKKKAAVAKISKAYRQMKVNKVFNAQHIMEDKGILVP